MRRGLRVAVMLLLGGLLLSTEAAASEKLFRWNTPEGIEWRAEGNLRWHAVYLGETQGGLPQGQGKLSFPDGSVYEGEFSNGLEHGNGTLKAPRRLELQGQFVDGQPVRGKMIFTDGSIYEGELKNGRYHGQGQFVYPNGRRSEGEFREGKLWNVTVYDEQGETLARFIEGQRQ